MAIMKKVLVLTLYSGENEFQQCKDSVLLQQGLTVSHLCIQGLGNKEAHEALYKEIVKNRDKFDFFVKLDADMILKSDRSLLEFVELFSKFPNFDHISIPLFDIPSNSFLMGIHIFTNRVDWKFPLDDLFPDAHPVSPGGSLIDYNLKLPIATHMANPSFDQCYKLGLHRASKIVQKGRLSSRKSSEFPISYLKRISRNRSFSISHKDEITRGVVTCLCDPDFAVDYKIKEKFPEKSFFIDIIVFALRSRILSELFFLYLRTRFVFLRRYF